MLNNILNILAEVLPVITPAYLAIYLTMSVVRAEISSIRLLFSAILIGGYSFIRLKLEHPTLLLDIIINVIALLLAKRDYTFLEFVKVALIYLIVILISTAFRWLIVGLFDPNEALLTIIVSISIVLTAFSVKVVNFVAKEGKKPKRCYLVEFANNGKSYKTKAYLDTGNMLYDKGKPVVVISPKISANLGLVVDREIAVSTISGVNLLKGGSTTIKIFLDKKAHKVLPIVYAISDKMNTRGYEVLLHKDMEQL
ncbi:MAG: sigma-E processing peptidase SpoIIGA [Clostridia bacterium]|nr:sigma-E processing peptidase SpoIIGA [Clostridia bacterium]